MVDDDLPQIAVLALYKGKNKLESANKACHNEVRSHTALFAFELAYFTIEGKRVNKLSNPHRLLLLLCLSQMAGFSGCTNSQDTPSADSQAAQDLSQGLQEQINRQAQLFPQALPSQFPEDFGIHDEFFLESFAVQTVLSPVATDELEANTRQIGFSSQLDNVGIVPPESLPDDSHWRYPRVLRSNYLIDASNNQPAVDPIQALSQLEPTQLVERLALDLASISPTSVRIRNNTLSLSIDGDSTDCQRVYEWRNRISHHQTLELSLQFERCPEPLEIAGFNRWRQATADVSARLVTHRGSDAQITSIDPQGSEPSAAMSVIELEGVAWMSQSWGTPPSASGAVLVDSLQLQLDDGRFLDVTRSKRRSGRGPRTVTAQITDSEGNTTPLNLIWEDGPGLPKAEMQGLYPGSVRLSDGSGELALTVRPLNRLLESQTIDGRHLHVPVTLSGSTQGVGFLDYYPLEPES